MYDFESCQFSYFHVCISTGQGSAWAELARASCGTSFLMSNTRSLCLGFSTSQYPWRLQIDWRAVPWSAWAALAWAGCGTSFLAHSAVSWAVGRCAAVIPSIYSCMQVCLSGPDDISRDPTSAPYSGGSAASQPAWHQEQTLMGRHESGVLEYVHPPLSWCWRSRWRCNAWSRCWGGLSIDTHHYDNALLCPPRSRC